MKLLKTGILTLTLTSLMTLSGCSDLFGKKVVDNPLDSTRFGAACGDIDVDQFALIMEENISSAINCLGDNLHKFIEVVKSEKRGYLSRVALEQYIKSNRPDIKPEAIKALKAVFDINFLIFGEDPNFMSKDNVDKLIEFALIFNGEAAVNFAPIFKYKGETNYNLYRDQRARIGKAAQVIISGLKNIFNPYRGGRTDELNIIFLMESFLTEENQHLVEKVKKLLFAKKVLIGGEKEVISHRELGRLFLNFDKLVLLALDAVRYKQIQLEQQSILQLLKDDVELLSLNIFQTNLGNRDSEVFFTVDEAIEGIKILMTEDDFDFDKYRALIDEAKLILMQGSVDTVTGADFKRFIDHGKSILTTGVRFHRYYDATRVTMENTRPVTISFEDMRLQFPSEDVDIQNFIRIVTKYRYFKGEFLSAYYTSEYRRNAEGIFEVSLYEYIFKLVFNKYGGASNGIGGKSMSKDQMIALLTKFEKVLVEMGVIYPGRSAKTAETVTLLGSLFQNQSDDNKLFDVNEATEFAISLFTALDVAETTMPYFKKQKCDIEEFSDSKYNRIEPVCFKKNFFKAICHSYRSYFPRLFQSLNAPAKCEDIELSVDTSAFLERSIDAARTCRVYPDTQEEIYYSEGDIFTLFLAMMHIETTIIRWDLRTLNNIMDADEVMDAYAIYSPALDGFLEDKPDFIKPFKKQIYQYMVKYEEVPNEQEFSSIWKFVKFLVSFNKKAPANRKTIASLLKVIGEQGTPSTFDCNLLHHPDQIPTDTQVFSGPLIAPEKSFGSDFSHLLEPYLHLAK